MTTTPSQKTTDFEIPYAAGTDAPPDMAGLSKAIAERVNAILKGVKGDATLASSLALTIANGAVTSQKLKPTLGRKEAEGAFEPVAASYEDVTGAALTLTPAVPSTLLVVATLAAANLATTSNSTIAATLNLDGTDLAAYETEDSTVQSGQVNITIAAALTLTAAAHTVKLRCKTVGGTGPWKRLKPGTGFIYLLLAS